MQRVLIIGSSRGLGLGLLDAHLEQGWEVHATTRDGSAARHHSWLTPHRLDVRDDAQLATLVGDLAEPMDRVIHNAGINHAPRKDLFEVNTDAPIRVVQTLLDAGVVTEGGLVAILSSIAGSRGSRPGSLGDYGDSKAALNDEFRRRVDDWNAAGASAIVVHPGWVRTDMGGPSARVGLDESVAGMMRVFESITPADHGRFLDWERKELPW